MNDKRYLIGVLILLLGIFLIFSANPFALAAGIFCVFVGLVMINTSW
jgi:hypothetical protein